MDASYATALSGLDEAGRAEYWASLALRHTRNLGARSIRRLLTHFGSALEAVQGVRNWDAAGVRADRATGLLDNSWRIQAQPEWNTAKSLLGRILLWTDPAYPDCLRELPDAPVLLYLRGRYDLLQGPCLAIVGKRQCSPEGLRAATYFADALAEAGVTVVSGLALGVDQAAHKAALGKAGSTLAILGTGLDTPYPRSALALHAQIATAGLLVSEFAPGTLPDPGNFPIRNRIISGLSLGVLVVEAAPRSGSLITARLALEQNRAVYAVPGALGAPTARGCQELIRQGANPVFAASDILRDLLPYLQKSVQQSHVDGSLCSQSAAASHGSGAPAACGTCDAISFAHGIPEYFTLAPPPPTPPRAPSPELSPALQPAQAVPGQHALGQRVPSQAPGQRALGQRATPHAVTQGTAHKVSVPPAPQRATPPVFRPDSPEARLLEALRSTAVHGNAVALDTLDESLDLPPASLSALLIRLEVQGLIRRLPGQYFMLSQEDEPHA